MKFLLSGAASIYKFVTNARNYAYDNGILKSYKSGLPVISIGNITAGGSGKTPLAIFIAEYLKSLGLRSVILTRGYGGNISGPYLIKGQESTQECGDEPILMARNRGLSVVISRDRVSGAEFIQNNKIGDVIILDDGLQHRRLRRDLNIITINVGSEKAVKEFIDGNVLPLGRMREDRTSALKRADIIIFSARSAHNTIDKEGIERIRALLSPNLECFINFFETEKVLSLDNQNELASGDVIALSAIANPEGFINSLKIKGFNVISSRSFPDHYYFKESDLQNLRYLHPHLPFVCTEKDVVKLQELKFPLDNIFYLLGNVRFENSEGLEKHLKQACRI